MPKMLELGGRDECRYPTTDEHFCGRKTVEGSSWCPRHHKICVVGVVRPLESWATMIHAMDGTIRSRSEPTRVRPLDRLVE